MENALQGLYAPSGRSSTAAIPTTFAGVGVVLSGHLLNGYINAGDHKRLKAGGVRGRRQIRVVFVVRIEISINIPFGPTEQPNHHLDILT